MKRLFVALSIAQLLFALALRSKARKLEAYQKHLGNMGMLLDERRDVQIELQGKLLEYKDSLDDKAKSLDMVRDVLNRYSNNLDKKAALLDLRDRLNIARHR